MSEAAHEGKHEAGWITISTDEYDSMKATIEVLSDPELMDQIKKSRSDFKAGKYKKLSDLLKTE